MNFSMKQRNFIVPTIHVGFLFVNVIVKSTLTLTRFGNSNLKNEKKKIKEKKKSNCLITFYWWIYIADFVVSTCKQPMKEQAKLSYANTF